MTPREDLYDLIGVMTKEERRYFRTNAKRYEAANGHKKYLQLYDAILASWKPDAPYSEEEIKRKLAGVIPESSFASMKRHLLTLLEENLRLFHAGKNDLESIHESMREAELLRQRGLVQRAERRLRDCRKRAECIEDHNVLLRINELERRFTIELRPKHMQDRELQRLQAEWTSRYALIGEENAYQALLQRVSLLLRSEFESRSKEVQARLPALASDPLLLANANPQSFRARRAFHQARAFVFHLQENAQAEFDEYEVLIRHWEASPVFIREHPRLYKLSLTNFLHAALKLKRWEVFEEIWAKAAKYPPGHFEEEAEDFQTIEFFRFLYRMNVAPLEDVLPDVDRLRKGLGDFSKKVNAARKMTFLFNFCLAYFHAGKFAEANAVLREILSLPKTEHRKDLQTFARVFEPVLDMASGNLLWVEERLHTLSEWLRVHNRLGDWEKAIIRNLGLISRIDSRRANDRKAAFDAFGKELTEIRERVKGIIGADDILRWVQAQAS